MAPNPRAFLRKMGYDYVALRRLTNVACRMMKDETRSVFLSLRLRPALKEALEKLAERDRRTLSQYVELLLERHAEQSAAKPRRMRT